MNITARQGIWVLLACCALHPAAVFAANACTEPLQTGSRATDRLPPMASVADAVLDQNLARSKRTEDLAKAIAILQRNQFAMTHPQATGSQRIAAFVQVRCGSAAKYRALNSQIEQRVRAAQQLYRQQRWFISPDHNQLTLQAFENPEVVNPSPGLLNLMLMANLYDAFETEAKDFLKAAVGDDQASAHFTAINRMIQKRLRFLNDWDQRYTGSGQGGVGLLPQEQAGFSKLKDLPQRLEPLRDAHVAHWIEREQETFTSLMAQPADKLLNLAAAAQQATAVQQLQLALTIARPDAKGAITALALRRGQTLSDAEHFDAAADYFKLAGADAKAKQATAANNVRAERRAERLQQSASELRDSLFKSDAERERFESDTDALADELGIDLDDF